MASNRDVSSQSHRPRREFTCDEYQKMVEAGIVDPQGRHVFTSAEYRKMIDEGILGPKDRVELIGGEILVKPPRTLNELLVIGQMNQLFLGADDDRFSLVRLLPLQLTPDFTAEPDLVMLRGVVRGYFGLEAIPLDSVLLAIEVTDSSKNTNMDVDTNLFAGAGIPELWLVHLHEQQIERFLDVGPEGYRDHSVLHWGDRLAPAAFPDREFPVGDVVSPRLQGQE